jgi:hypothetical protein
MRRIVLLVTVALVMAAMMLASTAVPVFADSPWSEEQGTCTTKQGKPGLLYERDTNQDKEKCFVDPAQFDY